MEARLSEQLKYRNGLLMAKGLPRREASRAFWFHKAAATACYSQMR